MTLGDFLNTLSKQSGIAETDQDLINLLSNAGISTAKISDGLASKIQNGLLTFDAAKENPDLKRYYTAMALNASDSTMENMFKELELPEDVVTELKSETSTYKRMANAMRKIKELEGKKIGATAVDKDKLAQQIDTLNQELATVKTNFVKEKSDLINSHKSDRVNWELNNHYSGYTYATQLSKEANIKMSQMLVNEEMAKAGLLMELADTNELKLKTKEGTEYYVNNKPVSIKDFLDKTLTTHKVISIEDPNKKTPINPIAPVSPQNPVKNTSALAMVDKMLADDMANLQQ
jgi:hypothetical protein